MRISKALAIVVLAALAATAWAEEAAVKVEQQADVLIQHTWFDTTRPAYKFNEYRSVPNGLVLDRYSLDLGYTDYRASFQALHVNQADQSYKAEGGSPGRFTYKAWFDDAPHVYANNAQSPYTNQGHGYLALPDELQAAMQRDAGLYVAISTGMLSVMSVSPNIAPLQVQNERSGVDFNYRPGQDWVVGISGSRLHKFGTKPMGTALGGGGLGIELPVPIDNNAYEVGLGADYLGKDVQAGAHYNYSKFDNKIPVLIWDNPKRSTDIDTTATKASSMARMALDPNNMAHNISASAGVNLPMRSRLSAEVGYSVMRQDDEFMPYTINTALSAGATTTSRADGKIPLNAWDPKAMPASNVDAKLTALNQNYRLSMRGAGDLRVSGGYQSYNLKNKGTSYTFPGYVGADQSWNGGLGAISNELFEYKKDKADVKADYDLFNTVSVGGGYAIEWKKMEREIPKTKEHQYSASLVFRPVQAFFVNGTYLVARRRMTEDFDFAGYQNSAAKFVEAPGLRRFDVSDRNRNQGRVQVGYTTRSDVSMSLSTLVVKDKYRADSADMTGGLAGAPNQLYGLTKEANQTYGAELGFPLGNAVTAELYGEHDSGRRFIQSNKGGAAPTAANDWTLRSLERSNGGGVALAFRPGEKLRAKVSYDAMYSTFDVEPRELGSALTYADLPQTKRLTQVARFDGTYKLTENLSFLARYSFEKFNIQDWAVDDIPLMSSTSGTTTFASDSIYLGNSLRSYVAHTVGLGLSYTF